MSSNAPGTGSAASDENDSAAAFAADLRRLRLDADSPTLARLQHDTGISKSVLSEAFAGRQLPSARSVDRIVRACDGDPEAWNERRDAIARSSARVAAVPPPADAPVTNAARPPGTVTRRTAGWIGAGAFFAGIASTAVAALLVLPLLAPTAPAEAEEATGAPLIAVDNGTDPALTECVDDAAVATGDTRADNLLLEIVWSDKCQAGWGRVTRYDGLSAGNTVTIAIYPETAPDGPDRQEATEHDVQGAYTGLVVRPSPDTLLCAEGSFTVDGTRIDLGDPLCI
jgi:hypothetical protein